VDGSGSGSCLLVLDFGISSVGTLGSTARELLNSGIRISPLYQTHQYYRYFHLKTGAEPAPET
jgi:hypothetical protein